MKVVPNKKPDGWEYQRPHRIRDFSKPIEYEYKNGQLVLKRPSTFMDSTNASRRKVSWEQQQKITEAREHARQRIRDRKKWKPSSTDTKPKDSPGSVVAPDAEQKEQVEEQQQQHQDSESDSRRTLVESPKEPLWRTRLWGSYRPRYWLHPLRFDTRPHAMSATDIDDLIELHTLPLRTRIDDDAWLTPGMQAVRIDDETQFELLTRGLRIAKQSLWAFRVATGRNHTGARSWAQVRLERNVLTLLYDDRCDGDTRAQLRLGHRQNCAGNVRATLLALVGLRNECCHYGDGGIGLAQVDEHFREVQRLAVQLYDEERAREARALRDELCAVAAETVAGMERLAGWAVLPYAGYPWGRHHEQMFGAQGREEDALVVVRRIAESWERQAHERREPVDFVEEAGEKKRKRRRAVIKKRRSWEGQGQERFEPVPDFAEAREIWKGGGDVDVEEVRRRVVKRRGSTGM